MRITRQGKRGQVRDAKKSTERFTQNSDNRKVPPLPFTRVFSFPPNQTTLTMADLMFSLGQTKGKKKSAAKVKETKDKLKDIKITGTVETEIRKDQHTREIKSKETARNQIKENMNVTVTDTVESGIRKDQHTREIKAKETKRNQIKENMNVTVTDTVESGIRKEQHTREIKSKETARNQIKENTNFDMARSLFGGGGGGDYESEEEEAQEEAQEEAEEEE